MEDRIEYKLCERVDATNASAVQKEMDELSGDGSGHFVIDFADNRYISSAGLRAVLFIQAAENTRCTTTVAKNANPTTSCRNVPVYWMNISNTIMAVKATSSAIRAVFPIFISALSLRFHRRV